MTTHLASIVVSWQSMAGQLLVSGLAVISGCQDIGSRMWAGAVFSFLIALTFGISALATGVQSGFRFAPAICALVFVIEILSILAIRRKSQ